MHNPIHYKSLYSALIFLFLCTIAKVLFAAPVPVETSTLSRTLQDQSSYGLGFTVSVAQRPFIGVDDQQTSLPYIKYHYDNFYIEGINFGYKFLNTKKTTIEFLATPRFYEAKPSFADDGELDGIDETKPTYLAGISAQYHTSLVTLTLQLLSDIKESDGSEIIASVSTTFEPSDNLVLAPAIGVTQQDDELVDHFYGVQANEVRIGRPEYKAASSTNSFLSLTTIWNANRHVQLLGQVKYERLGSGTTDSPIVNEDSIFTAVVGAVYLF